MARYPDVPPSPDFPALEKEILAFWKREGLFRASVESRAALKEGHNNEFIFYDGPPFANGLPHYGHLLTGFVKDAIARYQTMLGKRVERRFGWDCHGLPAEMGAEKELGISGRQAIQQFGIDKFNAHCRTSVMKYTGEWEDYVTRQARWVDFAGDYKTMDTGFMESVLWAFKQLYDKGLVYEAYRVMPYSWAAETPLSNFETKLDNSYREREDKAVTVAFELNTPPKGAPKADKYYVLAWTTTPWTLPANLALAVGKNIEYAAVTLPSPCRGEGQGGGDGGTTNVCYILGKNALARYEKELGISSDTPSQPSPLQGEGLVGLSYHPLFPYFKDRAKNVLLSPNHHIPGDPQGNPQLAGDPAAIIQQDKRAFKILDGSAFVTDGDGTGIVHMAPGFGEDDQKCCEENGIEIVVPVDGQGKYTGMIYDIPYPSSCAKAQDPSINAMDPAVRPQDDVLRLRGLNVIAEPGGSKYGLANDRIVDYLKKTGHLIKQETIKHNYPHCWRTDTPLIYRALPSWYVEVTKFRDRAVELNKQINWVPEHIRDGQMGHMLTTAPDWSISRNRFWGTPIPVWKSDKGNIKVFGSIAELKAFFGGSGSGLQGSASEVPSSPEPRTPNPEAFDLHRPFIDTLIKTDENGETWKRVEDVFDCWFESGSMPFAQVHYPFENKEWFERHFPADFITEYIGQTRGWFNTLIMLSTALFDKPPFLNCICHGVVLDAETGLKYSKRLKNYKDPMEVMDSFGADALRWLMLSSPVMHGADLSVDPEGKFIRDAVRLYIKPIWNAYHFFCLYANADSISCGPCSGSTGSHAAEDTAQSLRDSQDLYLLDRYILAKCAHAVEAVRAALDTYDTPAACDAVSQFFEVLNNWYIRRSKERFWKEEKDADKQAAYDTLYTVLTAMCRAAAPLLPLTTEAIYKGLTGEQSVHLATFPSLRGAEGDEAIQLAGSPRGSAACDDELIAQMDFARDVCNATLAIRNKLNIRVRQPLPSLTVAMSNYVYLTKEGAGISNTLSDIIRDEVNVKAVVPELSFSEYATLKLSLNNPVLGKRLPALMKQIIPAAKKGEWKWLDNGDIEICGETISHKRNEFTIFLEPKPEYKDRAQPLSTNDALVILDTEITPELQAEGFARDLVRGIQQARKDAGLHVSDRIRLSVTAPEIILSAARTNEAYIKEQTLADAFAPNDTAAHSHRAEITIDEHRVTVALSKT